MEKGIHPKVLFWFALDHASDQLKPFYGIYVFALQEEFLMGQEKQLTKDPRSLLKISLTLWVISLLNFIIAVPHHLSIVT